MSVTWLTYLKEIRQFLPGCPDVTIAGIVRNVAQDFCEATMCWQDTLDPFTVDANVRNIQLVPLVDTAIVQIQEIWNDTIGTTNPGLTFNTLDDDSAVDIAPIVLQPRTEKWLDRYHPGWRAATGMPSYYTCPTRDVLWLAPHPGFDGFVVNAKASLKPSDTSLSGPDDLYRDFRTHLQDGTLEYLLAVPGKPWTNPVLAAKFAVDYREDKGMGSARTARSNTRAPIRTSMSHRF